MSIPFNSKKIAAAFHQKAFEYDQHIAVQKRVVANLVKRIETEPAFHPGSILDIGSGTGSLLNRLHGAYPQSALYGVDLAHNMCLSASAKLASNAVIVNGDAARLPFLSGSFDLVVSTSALQWVADLSGALQEMRRVLKAGGRLEVAFFCEGTLCELQHCYREAAAATGRNSEAVGERLHTFCKIKDVLDILDELDFETFVTASEDETDWYENLPGLLRSIKSIGAGTVSGGAGAGLGWRGILNETARLYQQYYGQNGRIPATYTVMYLHARVAGL